MPKKIYTAIFTLQPEIIAKSILKTLFHVTEMGFFQEIIPKQFFHVILWITEKYVILFWGNSFPKNISCNWHVIFREINSDNKHLCM